VVFLAKYNALVLSGKKVVDAVFETGKARFRAIVLTTITTTVGLYPIILEKSFQAQFLKPMAIALAYGVFVGTGFILTFFPVAILVTNDMKRVSKYAQNRFKLWIKLGDKNVQLSQEQIDELKSFPTRESVENVIILQKNTID
jgi:predicted RND superfamily exporter protein